MISILQPEEKKESTLHIVLRPIESGYESEPDYDSDSE